jgi:hypothetical protein
MIRFSCSEGNAAEENGFAFPPRTGPGARPRTRFGNERASPRVFLSRRYRRPLQRPPEEFEDEFEERLLEEFEELLLELLLEEFEELFPAE